MGIFLKNISAILLLISCWPDLIYSQSAEVFKIRGDSRQITNSLYNKISFLDSRTDTSNMGIVHAGEFSKKTKVVAYIPVQIQLSDVLQNMIDETAANNHLLFQLRKLKFAESDADGYEKGFCFLRASLYDGDSLYCKKLATLDTVIVLVYTESNSTLQEEASKVLLNFISGNLTNKSKETPMTLQTVQHIDSVEKFNVPLYNPSLFGNGPRDTLLKNGVYLHFNSFRNQIPDMQLSGAVIKPSGSVQLKAVNKLGKPEKLSEEKFYAFVNEGQPYASAEFGAHPMFKYKGDYYFIGAGTPNPFSDGLLPKVSIQQLPIPAGKLTAADLNKSKSKKYYLILVDYIDGSFMRIKEIVP